ncbi:hypothetical protein EDD18DRAFT_1111600 [Armillaria luteobubalina]|uniref:Uncharacterized protein n=1 Tax=Armillaria luteobubalina TaxID=153913 RepID=A0AA39UDQ2_9AGAR|nr:hypothetical protein EDD18DRAFT_1111600 [Armillaria luteobubalina]
MSSESEFVDSVPQTVTRASARASISGFQDVLGALVHLKRASSEINVKAEFEADMMPLREEKDGRLEAVMRVKYVEPERGLWKKFVNNSKYLFTGNTMLRRQPRPGDQHKCSQGTFPRIAPRTVPPTSYISTELKRTSGDDVFSICSQAVIKMTPRQRRELHTIPDFIWPSVEHNATTAPTRIRKLAHAGNRTGKEPGTSRPALLLISSDSLFQSTRRGNAITYVCKALNMRSRIRDSKRHLLAFTVNGSRTSTWGLSNTTGVWQTGLNDPHDADNLKSVIAVDTPGYRQESPQRVRLR